MVVSIGDGDMYGDFGGGVNGRASCVSGYRFAPEGVGIFDSVRFFCGLLWGLLCGWKIFCMVL